MGNYHPHGDSAIYDTLVRMAQNFNMRYMLVDGQGQLRVDGRRRRGRPAWYTEARLTKQPEELRISKKKTGRFRPQL